jgi:hypothetical protein
MGLTEELLAITGAAASGGRRPVCLACPETLSSLDATEFVLVVVPGARVQRADGEVARAVGLAAGSVGGSFGGVDILVVGHEGCSFRSPSFGVPGPAPQGEAFATERDLVRHTVAQLLASPWLARMNVHGVVVDGGGRVDRIGTVAAATAPSVGGASPGASTLAPSGPVSFFGGSDSAAGPSLAGALPSSPGPARWESPPPIAAAGVRWEAPPPIAPAAAFSALAATIPQGATLPTVGAPPGVSAPLPTVNVPVYEPTHGSLEDALPPGIDVTTAPPPPRPAPQRPGRHGPPPPPPPTPPPQPPQPPHPPRSKAGADDPFARAEEILERMRRERKR